MKRTLSPPARAALQALKPAQLLALFQVVRSLDDAALLAAVHPLVQTRKKKAFDPLLAEVQAILRPILAGSAEKAAYLDAHMQSATGQARPPGGGLAQAVRFWAQAAGPEKVCAEAHALIAALAGDSRRESIP